MTHPFVARFDGSFSSSLRRAAALVAFWWCVGFFGPSAAAASTSPVVIELFTSQGCSSCPPADALLGELARQDNVIALAYHADYWDDLGWRDRFSIPEAARRQESYARRLSASGAFTPQSIVNGNRSFVGSDRQAIAAVVAAESAATPIRLSLSEGGLVIELPAQTNRPSCDVNVVTFLSEAATPIGRGENAHRTLHEFNIVRSFKRVMVWKGDDERFVVPVSSLPSDSTNVAVLLQEPGQGRIVGAMSIKVR